MRRDCSWKPAGWPLLRHKPSWSQGTCLHSSGLASSPESGFDFLPFYTWQHTKLSSQWQLPLPIHLQKHPITAEKVPMTGEMHFHCEMGWGWALVNFANPQTFPKILTLLGLCLPSQKQPSHFKYNRKRLLQLLLKVVVRVWVTTGHLTSMQIHLPTPTMAVTILHPAHYLPTRLNFSTSQL